MTRQAQLPDFDGATYRRDLDHERLAGYLGRVLELLSDHEWHTLREIRAVGGDGGDARMRDLRKQKFGGHRIVKKRLPGESGVWLYRLVPEGGSS